MSKKLKVCHFTSAHPAEDIRIFHKECVSLAKAGHEVYLVSAHSGNKKIKGVQFVGVNSPKRGRIGRMLITTREVYKKAKSLEADVYHFHDPELLFFANRLKRAGKIVIYDAHEDVPRQIMAKFWIPKLFRKIISISIEKFENSIARKLNAVVVSTPYIRERFIKINSNTVDICNYPLMQELVKSSNWEEKHNEICYVGGLSEVRGIKQLIDSLAFIPSIRLNLAGAFSNVALEQDVKARKTWKNVEFYGYVGRDELLSVFQRSKIGLVTLLATPNHVNSLPIKMFEYMGAGIPVISSDFPYWKDIVESNKCGICVDPNDPEAIAKGVQFLLDNQEEAREMGKNGRLAIIEKYNWEIEEKKLLDVYQSLS